MDLTRASAAPHRHARPDAGRLLAPLWLGVAAVLLGLALTATLSWTLHRVLG